MNPGLLRLTLTRFLSVGALNTVVGMVLIYGSKHFWYSMMFPPNWGRIRRRSATQLHLEFHLDFFLSWSPTAGTRCFLLAFAIAYVLNLLAVWPVFTRLELMRTSHTLLDSFFTPRLSIWPAGFLSFRQPPRCRLLTPGE